VAKKKLQRFAEMLTFNNVFQPSLHDIFQNKFKLKGNWNSLYFNNNNPIVVELGCGKGEYTVGLSRIYKDKNFIGVDIKGARMWKGAKNAKENDYNNVAFVRTRIEFIEHFFDFNEISEIWITFPDPQLKKRRTKKRLTSPYFLNLYTKFLKNNGIVHLKTDNDILYDYTLKLLIFNKLYIITQTNNLYNSDYSNNILSIKTFYEEQFLSKNKNINYLAFKLPNNIIIQPNNEDEE